MGQSGVSPLVPERITIRLTQDDGWWSAQIVEEPGAISQGKSALDACENVLDALWLLLDVAELTP